MIRANTRSARDVAIEEAARAVVEHDDRANNGGQLGVMEGVKVRAALRAALAMPQDVAPEKRRSTDEEFGDSFDETNDDIHGGSDPKGSDPI